MDFCRLQRHWPQPLELYRTDVPGSSVFRNEAELHIDLLAKKAAAFLGNHAPF